MLLPRLVSSPQLHLLQQSCKAHPIHHAAQATLHTASHFNNSQHSSSRCSSSIHLLLLQQLLQLLLEAGFVGANNVQQLLQLLCLEFEEQLVSSRSAG
jgi:hypothetical protein